LADGKILALVASSTPDRPSELGDWLVRTVVTGTQEYVDLPDEHLFPRLQKAQAVAITSPRAARWVAGRDFPAQLLRPVLVSGPATGAILPDRWVRLIPPTTGGAAVAELAHAKGYFRLLYLGAEETAGTLERKALSLGLELEHLAIYRTVPIADLVARDRETLDSARALAFLAPSAVRHLAELDPHRFAFLSRRLPAVACGEATRVQLSDSGWRDVRLARGTSTAEIAAALEVP
jgi:uroporphyrinogen-III synthase